MGEFNTNRILGVYASSVKQALIDKINELEENDNTRTERQEGETGSSNKFLLLKHFELETGVTIDGLYFE